MKKNIFTTLVLALVGVANVLVSCSNNDDDGLIDEVPVMIDEVRVATESYAAFSAGVAAGLHIPESLTPLFRSH